MSLKDEFTDTDYRRAYAESFANTVISTQIRLLRGSMTQKEFADLVGIQQSRVSAMEDENYSMWSTTTLKKLARAKDVVFLGRFVSFGELLNWSSLLSEGNLTVPSFANDPVFHDAEGGLQMEPPIGGGTEVPKEANRLNSIHLAMSNSQPTSQKDFNSSWNLKLVQSQTIRETISVAAGEEQQTPQAACA